MTRGVYPGSFNPPTIGHLAIIEAAIESHGLRSLDLVVSRTPLGKSTVSRPTLAHRVEVIEASMAHFRLVQVKVTDLRFIADIADGYDVVIMGADKWAQVNDVSFYDTAEQRDAAIARMPTVAVAARGEEAVPGHLALPLERDVTHVSSTAARAGAHDLMTPAARHFDAASGAWSDAKRYEQYLGR